MGKCCVVICLLFCQRVLRSTSVSILYDLVLQRKGFIITCVESLEFVLGILADTAYNCSAISYKGKLRVTFTSNLRNRDLERKFFTALVKSGVHVKIENTEKEEADD